MYVLFATPHTSTVLTSKYKTTQRLTVILSQASLETYKISSSGPGGDDYQDILKKKKLIEISVNPDHISHTNVS